jgi:hypothetical protein
MTFTAQQIRAIRQGRMTATLVPQAKRVRAGAVRVLRRCELTAALGRRPAPRGRPGAVLAFVEARLDLDPAVEVVCDMLPDGERVPVLLTILAVTDVTLDALTLWQARWCGFRTAAALRAWWTLEHPRVLEARLVRFGLGDLRDAPVLISAGWPDYTYDPARAMRGEPEPVSGRAQARLAADAGQRRARFRSDRARELAASTASERLAAVQRGTVVQPDTPA